MKYLYLILCVGFIMLLSILVGRHFYIANVDTMRVQAESAFNSVLEQELRQKQKLLNDPFSTPNVGLDTVPLVVYITTADGKQRYEVDAEKSKKNISQSYLGRVLQSVSLIKSPLSPDTLNLYWQNALCHFGINAMTSIQISVTDLNRKLTCNESSKNEACISSQFTFVSYIGTRCEVEVVGYLKYTCWMVCLYHWLPFFWNIIAVIFLCCLLYCFFRLKTKPPKIKIVKKEIVHEVVRYAKEVDMVNPQLYYLNKELVFDPKKQLLIYNKEEIKLSSQLSAVLKLFLDAPDYTVTDTDLVKNIWGTKSGATIQNFRSASQRIYDIFEKVNFPIRFIRSEMDKYTLVFLDNQ